MMMGMKPDVDQIVYFGLILLDVCRAFRLFETEKVNQHKKQSGKQKVELFSFILVPVWASDSK